MGEPDVTLVDTIGSLRGGHGESEFNNPSALASDYHGNLVVADTNNHRVVKLDAKGAFLWSLGGSDADGLPRPGTAQGSSSALRPSAPIPTTTSTSPTPATAASRSSPQAVTS